MEREIDETGNDIGLKKWRIVSLKEKMIDIIS